MIWTNEPRTCEHIFGDCLRIQWVQRTCWRTVTVDLRSRLDRLFAYKLSFVMSKYNDERVMFVKLVRVEITEKHLQPTTSS